MRECQKGADMKSNSKGHISHINQWLQNIVSCKIINYKHLQHIATDRYLLLQINSVLTMLASLAIVGWIGHRLGEGIVDLVLFHKMETETVVRIGIWRCILQGCCFIYGLMSFVHGLGIFRRCLKGRKTAAFKELLKVDAFWKLGLILVIIGLALHLLSMSDLVSNLILAFGFLLQVNQQILMTKIKKIKLMEILGVCIYLSALLVVMIYSYGVCRHHEFYGAVKKISTQAAVHTTDQDQLWDMSVNSDFYHASLYGKFTVNHHGLITIPGLKQCPSINYGNKKKSTCTSITPQGITVCEKYIFISAYCHAHKHNSVIFELERRSGKLVKEIVLGDLTHVGGLAYDKLHEVLWIASEVPASKGGKLIRRAGVASIRQTEIDQYDFNKKKEPIAYSAKSATMFPRASFITYYSGYIFSGYWVKNKNASSNAAGFRIMPDGVTIDSKPTMIASIPGRVQGMAFYRDKVILTRSYGLSESQIQVYDLRINCGSFDIDRLEQQLVLPQMLEQIYAYDDKAYTIFESGAFAYRSTAPVCMDHIPSMRLDFIISKRFDQVQ